MRNNKRKNLITNKNKHKIYPFRNNPFFNKLKLLADFLAPYAVPFAFTIIYLHLFFVVILPFFNYNSLFSVDMSGHYFSSWYIKEYLFPRASGWNPFFFFGFPQNQFYEPAFSYASALLSFVMPLEYAFKLFLSIVLVLTPLAGYYCARSFSFGSVASVGIMLGIYGVLLTPDWTMGGTIMSTISTGLVTHALGLMVFLFFLGVLNKAFFGNKHITKNKYRQIIENKHFTNKYVILSGLLLALLILSHLMSAIAGIIALLAFGAFYYKRNSFRPTFLIFLIGIVLSAFWLIPAILTTGFINSITVGNLNSVFYLFLLFLGFLAYRSISFRNADSEPIWWFLFALLIILFAGDSLFNATMHYYRFSIFIFILVPILIFSYTKKWQGAFFAGALIFCVFLMLSSPHILAEGALKKTIAPLSNGIDGRVLILSLPWQQTSEHELQQAIPMMNQTQGARGLYQESSHNAQLIYDMEYELAPYGTSGWYVDKTSPLSDNKDSRFKFISEQFKLLHITNVIATRQIDPSWILQSKVLNIFFLNVETNRIEKNTYSLYKAADSNLIDVLHYTPKKFSGANWADNAKIWFLFNANENNIFVDSDIPQYLGKGNETVSILEKTPTNEYIKFFVDSNIDVPIFIKISFFPNWHAYVNGKEIKIYQATPNFMLVNTHGIVELKFENTLAENLGYLVSLAGLIAIIGYVLITRRTKKSKSN
ncbi:MAG: hypothetical protein NTY48_05710 [Candidatus Diapherotrites archaeon]|nr:hypothetical protein [Candidatus Diapherotrites archaeon]